MPSTQTLMMMAVIAGNVGGWPKRNASFAFALSFFVFAMHKPRWQHRGFLFGICKVHGLHLAITAIN